MKVGDLEVEVGNMVMIDGERLMTVVAVEQARYGFNAYLRVEDEETSWELWYGTTDYYTELGWHGVDGEGAEDEEGAVVSVIE